MDRAGAEILMCRLTPDSRHVVAAVGSRQTLRMWDVGTGMDATPAWLSKVSAAGFRFTPNGKVLLTHAANNLTAWAWPAGTKLWSTDTRSKYTDGRYWVQSIAVSPDGRHFATIAEFNLDRDGLPPADKRSDIGIVDLWDLATGKRVRRLAESETGFHTLGFASDRTLLLSGNLTLPGDFRGRKPGMPYGLFAVDSLTGKLIQEFDAKCPDQIGGGQDFALSADGRTLFWAADLGTLEIYEVATGQLRATLPGHRDAILSIDTPTNDVRRVASASGDTTVLWWDVGFHGKPAMLSAEERNSLWKELGATNARRGFYAMTKLAADPAGFVGLAASRLKPVPRGPTAAELASHFKNLAAKSFAAREAAIQALDLYGETAVRHVRARLNVETDPEARERLSKFLERHVKPDNDPQRLRHGRAIELLEHLGTPETKDLLAKLAKGGPGKLTADAAAALKRLASR